MNFEFVPVDYGSFDFEGKNYICIVGRTGSGRKVCLIDKYEANFWVILKKGFEKKAEKLAREIEKIEVKKASRTTRVLRVEVVKKRFLEKPVVALRVFVGNHKDAHDIASAIGDREEIEFRREYDLSLITKYIKEGGLSPLKNYFIDAEPVALDDFGGYAGTLDVDCFLVNSFKEEESKGFEPKVLAFDIEASNTSIGKGDVYMISLYGKGLRKVLTWRSKSEKEFVEYFSSEREMIKSFEKYVREYDPDFLVGYFSDGFDLPYLRESARSNGLDLRIGVDGKAPSFTRGRIPTGRVFGRVHIDLFRFIDAVYSQYLQSETLSLNEVASELLGEKKHDFDFSVLENMKRTDWERFYEYNLQDSILTYKLFFKLWDDVMEFTKIIHEPVFNITRDRMASHVENYIVHNLDRFDEIAEKRPSEEEIRRRRSLGKYEGAFVFQPSPGLYEDLVMFDFTSMYPSVIVSYNLSKSTYLGNGKFSKKKGFFPLMLEEVIKLRKKFKKRYQKDKSAFSRARSNAYKLLANASYGYLGFFGARYYCREAAEATTRYARENIKKTMKEIGERGYDIVYGDTDSIAFLRKGRSKREVLKILSEINKNLPGIMELDLEDFYKRGLFVSKRSVKEGAKKKYALLSESGKFKIRGFETVRRDWCWLSRKLQDEIIREILVEGSYEKALSTLKRYVSRLKRREVDRKELIIKTQLKKPISEYLSKGPHVVAALKMRERGIPVSQGMLVEYYIGEGKGKKKLIRDRVFLVDEDAPYDVDYYLNNQILPAVENIFEVFGIDVKKILDNKNQTSLDSF